MARELKITLAIGETTDNPYLTATVAETSLTIPLPASATDVAAAVASQMVALNEQVNQFRGEAVLTD